MLKMKFQTRIAMYKTEFHKEVSVGLFLFLSFILLAAQNAHASGYAIFTQSASSLGQGAAVVSHTDSPSTIFFNPALMNGLDGAQAEIGTTLLFPERKFTSDSTGITYKTQDDVFYPSTFYLTQKINSVVSVGLGFFSPFGLGTDWGDTWEGRYITTKAKMETYNINPAVSVKVMPKLSLAAGVDIVFLNATFEKKINSGMGFDISQKFTGDGTGIGCNFGLLYDITDNISLGVAYRSEVKVDIDGDGSFDPQVPLFGLVDSPGHSNVTLPQQVFAGISYKGFERWVIEAGMRWEDWSTFKSLNVNMDSGLNSSQQRNWKDTYAYNIGVQYRYNDMLTLRLGYLYGQNPVPDSTFDPTIPDSDTHLFCIGTGLNFGRLTVDLAYGYQLQKDRDKENDIGAPAAANGKYSTYMNIVAASLKYRF
jgi:long-chain fatty acid transport protein